MINIILDTDLGSDCDDMMAISYLISEIKKNNVNLNAVTISHMTPYAYPALVKTFEISGIELSEVGQMKHDKTDRMDFYCEKISNKYNMEPESDLPDAYKILRKALAQSKEKVIICGIGPMNNIADLINSEPDEISELSGKELIYKHCSKIVLMAGGFVKNEEGKYHTEWNVVCDIEAAKTVMSLENIEIDMVPYEIGLGMITGLKITEKYKDNLPLTIAFSNFNRKCSGRDSWDPTTVLYATKGCTDKFEESGYGKITVTDDGETLFSENEKGLHRVIKLKCADGENYKDAQKRVAAYIDDAVEKLYDCFIN